VTRREFAGLVAKAEKARFPENLSILAGNAADALRDYPRPVLSLNGALALIRWQAVNLNGSWDEEALNEVFLFMRPAVVADPEVG